MAACSTPGALGIGSRPGRSQAATAASRGAIAAFVPTAEAFVEARRGLRFKHPVEVGNLSDAAFGARIAAVQRGDRSDLDRQARVLRALRLVPAGVDVERAEEDLLRAQVIGYYDPKTKTLVVRGDGADAAVRHVVVHELTHALQDQWFDLEAHERNLDDDASAAYTALVEGDAVRVERAYIHGLTLADRQQIDRSGGGSVPSDVPPVLLERLEFPYTVGPTFVQALLDSGGRQRLDQAFLNPPPATSEVLHPEQFLAGSAPRPPGAPLADGPAIDQGSIGELGLDLLLQGLGQSAGLSRAQIRAATGGWAGDRYVAWSSGRGACVRARFATHDEASAAALTAALQGWAGSRPGATVTGGSEPELTSCG